MDARNHVGRRALLRCGAALGAAAASGALAACSAPRTPPPDPAPRPSADLTTAPTSPGRVLLVYFSRAGENYYRGGRRDLDVGNTEVLARQIAGLLACDVHRLEAADPYATSYDATVARNVREQDDDARPAIANPLDSISRYDSVLVGSPIWNVRPPMIIATFAEALDFTGTTVHPFVTHAVSGLGRAERDYGTWCRGARIAPGLAVQGEEAADHRADVEAWLRDADLAA